MQVMHMDLILFGIPAKLIRRPMYNSALYAAPGEPHAKAETVMIAALRTLGRGGSAELSTPDYQRIL